MRLLRFTRIEEQRRFDVLQVRVRDLGKIGEQFVELWRELIDLSRAEVYADDFPRHFLHGFFRHTWSCGHRGLLHVTLMGSQRAGDQPQTSDQQD
jgi:hypothetical protein